MLASPAEALEFVEQALRERYSSVELDGSRVSFAYRDEETAAALFGYVEVSESLQAVLMRMTVSMPVEPAFRAATMELITRLNHKIPVGAWALDLDDGDLRFKSGFYVGTSGVQAETIADLIDSAVFVVETQLHGVICVMVGRTVQEALDAIESGECGGSKAECD